MARNDLLALSPDDLAALTNRGTVKRAHRELDGSELSCDIDESDGGLVISWSDGVTCTFPVGKTIHDAICSSGSIGISRHIVRSVLVYQHRHQTAAPGASSTSGNVESGAVESGTVASGTVASGTVASSTVKSSSAGEHTPSTLLASEHSWDPGEIGDDDLIRQFRKAAVTRARKLFEQGVLVEVVRGNKPVARFLHESCTVRFPVPGDVRYATADCAEALLPQWVSLAVWAFREFDSERLAGLLSIQQASLPVPHDELDQLDTLIAELCHDGIAAIPPTWPQRVARLEKRLRAEGLVWPAELMLEILHQHERYREQDARFDPREVVHLIGEVIARSRAIRADNAVVPQLLIRGAKWDRRTDIKGSRFVGVGLGVQPGRQHTTLNAFLQDSDTGMVVAIQRTFTDPDPESGDEPKDFTELAALSLIRGVSLGSASLSQLLLRSGKRTPAGELILPRGSGKLTTNPQSFQWEQLKPPFAADNFEQLRQRFETLPPSWLRPRRRTENLHAVAVTGATDAEFDVVSQQMIATLRDVDGERATLIHPFHSRGLDGFNDLNTLLQTRGEQIRFVCGHVRMISGEICIHPVSIIVEDGNSRLGVNPWIANQSVLPKPTNIDVPSQDASQPPIAEFLHQLRDDLADALLTGLRQANPEQWASCLETSRQLGFVRLAQPIEELANELSMRRSQVRWDAKRSASAVQHLCMLARLLE